MLDPGIVDQDIDCAELLLRERDKPLHVTPRPKIRGIIASLNIPGRGDRLCEVLAFLTRTTTVEDEMATGLCQSTGDPLANASG